MREFRHIYTYLWLEPHTDPEDCGDLTHSKNVSSEIVELPQNEKNFLQNGGKQVGHL